jgi:hypothetical protein
MEYHINPWIKIVYYKRIIITAVITTLITSTMLGISFFLGLNNIPTLHSLSGFVNQIIREGIRYYGGIGWFIAVLPFWLSIFLLGATIFGFLILWPLLFLHSAILIPIAKIHMSAKYTITTLIIYSIMALEFVTCMYFILLQGTNAIYHELINMMAGLSFQILPGEDISIILPGPILGAIYFSIGYNSLNLLRFSKKVIFIAFIIFIISTILMFLSGKPLKV